MHVFTSMILGLAVWFATMAAVPSVWTVAAGPLIVSGVTLIACFSDF